ncbi:MAG TPA: serine/threonine-protein kinase [Labilithrix sp.]|nr:serine/threonine-protein kinase [Labilithrix sp.]
MFGPPLAGRYAIRRELGNGASARVYVADDQKLGRAVAVKVLNASSAHSPEAVQRLEREGRVSAVINHPNVCAVSDVGRLDNGLPFLVMEHLAGETLADRLDREKRLPVEVAVGFAEQMLLGLHAAHRLGIVHRDLKPANVFLVDLGLGRHLLKLLDFGTAYLTGVVAEAQESLTRVGLVVGTPEYMAPEQLRGLRDFDARTDVYACGVVVYEMISGRRPFQGLPLDQLCQAIAFKQPTPLAQVAPFVPAPIARAVDVALALNPNRRHADAAAFLAALRQESVPEVPATAAVDVRAHKLAAASLPNAPVADEWDLPTTTGVPRPSPSPAPSVPTGGDWDLVTHESGPPSMFGTSPLTAPILQNAPGPASIDVDIDETLQPQRPPRR